MQASTTELGILECQTPEQVHRTAHDPTNHPWNQDKELREGGEERGKEEPTGKKESMKSRITVGGPLQQLFQFRQ